MIRPATAADKSAILEFTEHTWDGGDYISVVWEQWLSDTAGLMLVAEQNGRAVGLLKVSWLRSGEAWIEGVRVAPAARRQGLASSLYTEAIDWAIRQNARVLRFVTAQTNEHIHRLANSTGFERKANYTYLWTLVEESQISQSKQLSMDCIVAVKSLIDNYSKCGSFGELYPSNDWHWLELNEERIDYHLRRGEILACPTGDSSLDALAIVCYRDPRSLWLAYLGGVRAQIKSLAYSIRCLGFIQGFAEIRGCVPTGSLAEHVLQEVGYQARVVLCLYEKIVGVDLH